MSKPKYKIGDKVWYYDHLVEIWSVSKHAPYDYRVIGYLNFIPESDLEPF